MSLANKKIVICRRPGQASEMVNLLKEHSAEPFVFSTFNIKPINLSSGDASLLQNLRIFDWLVLGSSNGVAHFSRILDDLNISSWHLAILNVGVVGKKTAAAWTHHFPEFTVHKTANNLQTLLDEIADKNPNKKVSVINPTSRQSIHNIPLNIPANVSILRIPLYETTLKDDHDSSELGFIQWGHYDAIFFGSPSSFDFFIELVGRDPLEKDVAICIIGETTANHIRNAGFRVAVVPPLPDVGSILKSLENYFKGAK